MKFFAKEMLAAHKVSMMRSHCEAICPAVLLANGCLIVGAGSGACLHGSGLYEYFA